MAILFQLLISYLIYPSNFLNLILKDYKDSPGADVILLSNLQFGLKIKAFDFSKNQVSTYYLEKKYYIMSFEAFKKLELFNTYLIRDNKYKNEFVEKIGNVRRYDNLQVDEFAYVFNSFLRDLFNYTLKLNQEELSMELAPKKYENIKSEIAIRTELNVMNLNLLFNLGIPFRMIQVLETL